MLQLEAELQRSEKALADLRLQGTPSRHLVEKSKMAAQMQRLRDELNEKEVGSLDPPSRPTKAVPGRALAK